MEAKKNILDYIRAKGKVDLRQDYDKPEIKKTYSKPELKQNYFEDFAADFLMKIKSESDENNSQIIDKQTNKQTNKQTKIIFLKPVFWISSIAASIIVIFGINYFLNDNTKLSEISESEILAYVEENSDDFTAEEIQSQIEESVKKKNFKEIDTTKSQLNNKKEGLNEKSIQENQIPQASFNELLDSFSEEDLYLYLNSDEVDLEDLEIL